MSCRRLFNSPFNAQFKDQSGNILLLKYSFSIDAASAVVSIIIIFEVNIIKEEFSKSKKNLKNNMRKILKSYGKILI